MFSYIHDKCSLYLYADDSALAVSGKDISETEADLKSNMEVQSIWLAEYKLSLHLGKTECILFGSRKKIG